MKRNRTKAIVLTLTLATAFVFAACTDGKSANGSTPTPTPAAVETPMPTPSEQPAITPTLEPTQEPTVDPNEVRLSMETNMLPILDAIARTMGTAGAIPYAPEDPQFFWSVLYYASLNAVSTHPEVTTQDDEASIPGPVMQEFAKAAFQGYDELNDWLKAIQLPEDSAKLIKYDSEKDIYTVTLSDLGALSSAIGDVTVAEDGKVNVKLHLSIGSDELMGTIEFTLVKYPFADGVSDSLYLYMVASAVNVPLSAQ